MSPAVGMGTSLAGGIMQAIAAGLAKRKMQQQFQSELNKQRGFQQQAFGDFSTALPAFGAEQAQRDIGSSVTQRLGDYGRVEAAPMATGAPPASAIERAMIGRGNEASAGYRGYADWQKNVGTREQDLSNILARIMFRSRGQANVFPYQMYDAQHRYDWLQVLGQLVSAAGGAASSFDTGGPSGGGMTNYYGAPGYTYSGPDATYVYTGANYSPF